MKIGVFNLMPQRESGKSQAAVFDDAVTLVKLAEELGLMIPGDTRQLLVDLGGPAVASVDEGDTQ